MREFNLKQWVEEFDRGTFSSPDCKTQCRAGWWDWFCKDTSLAGKTRKLAPKVKRIARSEKIDPLKTYVWFKNNCPVLGSLYDDFRIADLETGDTIYTITPACGHTSTKGKADVWGKENDFTAPLVEGTWKDICNFFGV